jgi:hypothetical protein
MMNRFWLTAVWPFTDRFDYRLTVAVCGQIWRHGDVGEHLEQPCLEATGCRCAVSTDRADLHYLIHHLGHQTTAQGTRIHVRFFSPLAQLTHTHTCNSLCAFVRLCRKNMYIRTDCDKHDDCWYAIDLGKGRKIMATYYQVLPHNLPWRRCAVDDDNYDHANCDHGDLMVLIITTSNSFGWSREHGCSVWGLELYILLKMHS